MENTFNIGKFKIKDSTAFFFLFMVISILYGYNHILFERPIGMHQWRGAFSASYAMEYYNGAKFLEPQTYCFVADDFESDIAVAEFPLLYYVASILYKIFGPHEFLFRLLNVIIGYWGLLSLYKFSREFLDDKILSFVIPIIVFSSEIFVFYLNNFIPDSVSLSTACVGLYQFYKYIKHQKIKFLVFSMLLFAFGGLMKPSSLYIYFGILFLFGLQVTFSLKDDRKIFKHPLRDISIMVTVLVVIVAWFLYKRYYTGIHGFEVSEASLRGIWGESLERRKIIWQEMKRFFIRGYYHSPLFIYVSGGLFIFNLIFIKKFNRILNILTILTFIQGIVFILFFFHSLGRCDYYLINHLMFLALLYLNLFVFFKNNFSNFYKSIIFKVVSVLLVALLVNDCRVIMQRRYTRNDWFYNATMNETEKYFKMEPYLRYLGIKQTDRVFVTPDPSINITLYLLNQNGNTNFGIPGETREEIELLIPKGLKYIIIGDTSIYSKNNLDDYLDNKIGEFGGADIYKVTTQTTD